MSVIRYGKVWGNLVRTNFYKRTAVYNGTDYLYTKHLISWRLVVSPQTQAELYQGVVARQPAQVIQVPVRNLQAAGDSMLDGQVLVENFEPRILKPGQIGLNGPLVSVPGQIAAGQIINGLDGAITSENLKSNLMQPRQVLQWWINGQRVLICPLPGFNSDSAGGPLPVSLDVVEVFGSRTFLVDFVIECAVNESPRFSTVPSPVLSNQWSASDEIGPDFMAIRTYEGVAVFDRQLLSTPFVYGAATVLADQMRAALFPAIAVGWKREHISMKVDADGVTCHWRCVDREVNVVIGDSANLVTDVQATHTISLDSSTADQQGYLATSVTAGLDNAFRVARDTVRGSGNPISANIEAILALAAGGAALLARLANTPSLSALDQIRYGLGNGGIAMVRNATLSQHRVEVKMTGKKLTNRAYLERLCRTLMIQRISYMKNLPRLLQNATSTYDLATSSVSASCQFLGGPILGQNVNDPLPMAWNQGPYRPESVNNAAIGTPADQGVSPVLGIGSDNTTPSDDVSRGSAVELLVTAALTDPYDRRVNLTGGQPPQVGSGNPPPINTGAGNQVNAPGWPRTAPRI